MGDSRRFDLFSKLIGEYFPRDFHIADVASGKGYLQSALRQLGFSNITSWDKRKRNSKNRKGYRYGYFNYKCEQKYNALVALHPDEATDHSILYAGINQVSAIICPCCVKPDAVPLWGDYNFNNWIVHLKQLASKYNLSVEDRFLKMNGRNLVLILKPIR